MLLACSVSTEPHTNSFCIDCLQLARATYDEVRRRGFSFLDVGDTSPTPQQVSMQTPGDQASNRRTRRPAEKAA